jgi:hypothetical protein
MRPLRLIVGLQVLAVALVVGAVVVAWVVGLTGSLYAHP